MSFDRKQKRCYGIALSGLVLAELRKENVRFMTLTTSPAGIDNDIMIDWQILDKRIQRQFNFKPQYIRVKTNEGNGVLHIIYKGKYIPQRWLSSAWNDIHKSPIVSIEWVRNTKQMASYLTQYISSQHGSYQRYSCSHYWIAPGYAKVRHSFKEASKDFSDVCYSSVYDVVYFGIDFNRFMKMWRHYLYNLVFPNRIPSDTWLSDDGKFNTSRPCPAAALYPRLNPFTKLNNPRSQSVISDYG